jgi:diguanylate cyclase (GGDEF)-like protein
MAPRPANKLPTLRDLLARAHLRLILFTVVLASASLMLSGVLVIRAYAQRNLELMAHTVAYTVEPAVVFQDRQAILDGMTSVGATRGIDRLEVCDPDGKVLASWDRPHSALRGWAVSSANALIWPEPARADVVQGGTVIARVKVYGNSGGILRYILAATVIALTCVGLTVLATRILARRLQNEVIAPLDHVAEVAHAVRQERAFEKRVPASGIAEIDRFGQDFNALLAELQGWHAGLTSENAELQRRATHDGLTGLGNRALFDQKLAEAVAESQRSGTPFALLYLDVDRFKQVNDLFGHTSGDAALIAVGERLRAAIRHIDSAFRLGGDEFAVVLAPFFNRAHVDGVVHRIRASMESPFRMPGGQLATASLSVGVAVFPEDGESAELLLSQADTAMYRDKESRYQTRPEGAQDDA